MTDSTTRLSALEARLDMLEAHEKIRQLAKRYAVAADRSDVSMLRSVFAPGAVVVLPRPQTGSDGGGVGDTGSTDIRDPADLLVPLAAFERVRHVIFQQVIDVDGDIATGVTYGEAHHLYRRAGELCDYALVLRYHDAFARTADGWRFTRREL